VPGEADLDTLNTAIEAAAIKRITDKVMPGGVPIGQRGNSARIRELPGGLPAAQSLFDYLRVGGSIVHDPDLEGSLIRLPGDVGYITFRAKSTNDSPAIDVNVPGVPFRRIHFK
jgi:hypothetical protein